jgi:dihydroxyacetone kinase-like protein
MTAIDAPAVRQIIRRLKDLMDEHREQLLELDRAIGDGDLGLTMTKAFTAADAFASASTEALPGRLLAQVGMAAAKAAPSTMGTLVATGFMRGGKAVGDAATLETAHMATFFRAFVDGIMERGKTRPGNKTVVDALDPAANALTEAAERGDALRAALAGAAAAAEAGRDAARQLMSQHGKASAFREQTIGVDDPGAHVGALIVRGFSEAVGH